MKTTISIITALALVSAVNAQEKKHANIEAQQLMERAKQAKEAGRYDEAKSLWEQAQKAGGMHREVKPGGDKGGSPERLEKVRHEIEELHRAGKHEEAEQLKHRIAESIAHKKEAPQPKEGEGPAKIRHVMEAIKHLREAGLNEPAEGLEKLARGMREQFEHREQAEKSRKPEPGPKGEPSRKADKPRPQGDELHMMREQMEKMAHAIEELRAQVRSRGDEEVRKPRKE